MCVSRSFLSASVLRLFQRSVLCHQLLLAVIRKADGQLCILALAFRPKDRPDTEFGVPDLRPDSPARVGGGARSGTGLSPTQPAALEKPLDARDGIDRIVPVRSRLPTQTRRTERLQKFPRDLLAGSGKASFPQRTREHRSAVAGPRKGSSGPSLWSCPHNRAVALLRSPPDRRARACGETVLPPCPPAIRFRIPGLWRYAESSELHENVRRSHPRRKPAKRGPGTPRVLCPALRLPQQHSPIPGGFQCGLRIPADSPVSEFQGSGFGPGCA